MKISHRSVLSIALIGATGIAAYFNSLHCSFHFDDPTSILDNYAIRDISNLGAIWNYLPRRFILYLSLALNYHLNGLNVFGYHLFNLGIHLATAVLVWWFVLLTLETPAVKKNDITQHAHLLALFAGLIFVSHPIQTQAVTYIVQRAASLATMFYLLSLCFYIKSRLPCQPPGLTGLSFNFYYTCALISCIAGMFTKETVITLPLMILLYEFTFLTEPNQRINWKGLLPFLLCVFIIPITILLTETNPGRLHVLQTEPGISSFHYLLTQFRVTLTYIRLLFLPIHQNADYDYPISTSLFELPTLLSLIVSVGVLGTAKYLFSKYRLLSFSIFWFFLTLLPESSIFPIHDVIFEHRLYLPMVGFSLFMVSLLYYLLSKNSIKIMIIVLSILVAAYSVLTFERNKVWKDDMTLWTDVVQKSPHKARGYGNRGYEYYLRGNFPQALSDVNQAIAIEPNYAAHNVRGIIYAKEGLLPQARIDFNQAIAINPNYDRPYNNLGIIDADEENFLQAIADFNKAIQINPHYTEAYNGLKDAEKRLEITPQNSNDYLNRGSIYAKAGKLLEAMDDFNKSIELDPHNASAYTNRGYIYAKENNLPRAVLDISQAIAINPKLAVAYNNRAILYYELKEYAKAWADVQKVKDLGYAVAPNYYNAIKDKNPVNPRG